MEKHYIKPFTIAFDVDGTLKDYNDLPRANTVYALNAFVAAGFRVIVWSGGGKDYAKSVGRSLVLPSTVEYHSKIGSGIIPDIAIDDMDVNLGLLNLKVDVLEKPQEVRQIKLAAFCPDPNCDGNCQYQSHQV